MEELTIEQKAQRYDEAIERAKKWYNAPNVDKIPTYANRIIEELFPELCESEDEKVRKALLELVRQSSEVLDKQNQNNMIAWLEKQGTPNQVSIWKHWKDGICGNGEGKLIYLIKDGNNYRLSSCLGYECDYILLSDLDNLTLEKQETSYTKRDVDNAYVEGMVFAKNELEKQDEKKSSDEVLKIRQELYQSGYNDGYKHGCEDTKKQDEQKHAEWSEEDEDDLNNIIWLCDNCIRKCEHTWIPSQATRIKSLIERIKDIVFLQPKQQWSEKDDMMIEETLYFLREYQQSNRCKDENGMQNSVSCEKWLKSLKDRVRAKQEWSEEDDDELLSITTHFDVKEVDLDSDIRTYLTNHFNIYEDGVLQSKKSGLPLSTYDIIKVAEHFFELGMAVNNKAQKGE